MEVAEYALMDRAEQQMWWYRALHTRLAAALHGVLDRQPAPRVLDAGCGTGGLLARLGDRAAWVGLDASAAALDLAQRKTPAPLACGSVDALPFADASFDAAVAADLLCHRAVSPPQALAELRRVLRPGGRLVINMPAFAWLASAHDRRVHNARRQTASELGAMLRAAGFDTVRTRYWNFLLLPLVVVQRKLLARGEAASDVAMFPPWLDALFGAVIRVEQRLPFALPGSSILATAIRPAGP